MSKNYVVGNPMGTLDTATMLVAGRPYQITDPIKGPAFLIRVINRSNIGVLITYGTIAQANDNELIPVDYCPSLEELQLNFQTNSRPNNQVALLPTGFAIWAISPVPGIGNIFGTCYYQIE